VGLRRCAIGGCSDDDGRVRAPKCCALYDDWRDDLQRARAIDREFKTIDFWDAAGSADPASGWRRALVRDGGGECVACGLVRASVSRSFLFFV